MKKIIALVLLVSLAVIMTACGDAPKYEQVGPAPTITEPSQETSTDSEYPTEDESETAENEIPMDENQEPSENLLPNKPSGNTNNKKPSSSGNSSSSRPSQTEPTTDEPTTEEPETEEPSTGEPSTEEPTTDEPVSEESEESTRNNEVFMG